MVKCERCGGFMVRDNVYNIGGQFLKLEVGRCVNCGHTVDLTLLQFNPENNGEARSKKERAVA